MKQFLFLCFSICLYLTVVAKGGSGVYYIKGTAYGLNKSVLRNITLKVKTRKITEEFQTDENGEFEIKIHWTTACPSGLNKHEREEENTRLNPEFIFVNYQNMELRLANEWKRYGKLFAENKEEITQHKDLLFEE